jgi:hypothetical protein
LDVLSCCGGVGFAQLPELNTTIRTKFRSATCWAHAATIKQVLLLVMVLVRLLLLLLGLSPVHIFWQIG